MKLTALLLALPVAAMAQGANSSDVTRSIYPWRLTLTCGECAQPVQTRFRTNAACHQYARHALYDRNINVPAFRCEERR